MFLSVVIPAYNEERYLPACLAGLKTQTYPTNSYEVIVVDNASTDRTAQIAQDFGVRVVSEPVKGIAHARQTGFQAARGEVIASTDADTAVPSFWVERIAAHFARNPELGGVYGPVDWLDSRTYVQLIMKYPVRWALEVSNLIGRSWWIGSNFAVRAEVFWQVGGFSDFDPLGLMGEDLFFSLKVSGVSPVLFDQELVVFASSRRTREGYLNYLRRMALSAVRVAVLRQPALPHPDIR